MRAAIYKSPRSQIVTASEKYNKNQYDINIIPQIVISKINAISENFLLSYGMQRYATVYKKYLDGAK
jgi:hypothetical protein